MKSFSKALAVSSALAATGAALAQDTTTDTGGLAGLLGGAGVIGVAVLALIVFVVWRFFFSGGGD